MTIQKGTMTETIIAAALAALLSPTAAWLMLKGKLDERYVIQKDFEPLKKQVEESITTEDLDATAERLEGEINGVGRRVDSNKTGLDLLRGEHGVVRDRLAFVEAGQNPVVVGMTRLETKLDRYMEHQEEHGRLLATHTEQIRTLFEQRNRGQGQ